MSAPDVTVIVAVYNTMPYLTDCLDSLVGQTIGRDRLEIVAVDDGSTDGSGAELDRFAALHPDVLRVVHQENSGGPAAPSNRALDLATGRYVFFVGADDHLGPEALARMVHTADTHDADVVVGRMVGTGGRYVYQGVYRRTDLDASLYDSELPYAMSNTKLFRRELVERHALRYPEDMPTGSDQPFTVEACVRARRISVLADYTFYYAVRRKEATNITYRADHPALLDCTERIMHFTAGLLEPGPQRDALLARHFTWGLSKLIQTDFLELDEPVQKQVCTGIAELADAYLTDRIRDGLDVRRRHRLCLAQRGAVEELRESLRGDRDHEARRLVLSGGRTHVQYPGFRSGTAGLPDSCYQVGEESLAARLAQGIERVSAQWGRGFAGGAFLDVTVRLPVHGDSVPARILLADKAMPSSADKPGARRLRGETLNRTATAEQAAQEVTTDDRGTLLRARCAVDPGTPKAGVRVLAELAGSTYEIPVPGDGGGLPGPVRFWRGLALHQAVVRANTKGRLVVETTAIARSRALPARLRRALRNRRKKNT